MAKDFDVLALLYRKPLEEPPRETTDPAGEGAPDPTRLDKEAGVAGWVLLWFIGVPVPNLLLLFILRGCT